MAQRHPTSRSRTPESGNEPDDVFVAKVFEFSVWARNNSQTLILMGVVLAVLVGGGIYYLNYRANLSRQANIELERIQQTLATGDVEAAKTQLSGYLERFGGTDQAEEARLLLGQTNLATDQAEVAIQVLEGASLRTPMGVQTGMLLAKAYEELGRYDESVEQFLEVADVATYEFQRREALAEAALVRSVAGDHAGAAEIYRRIIEGFEDENESVDQRGLYELRLAEAETAAEG